MNAQYENCLSLAGDGGNGGCGGISGSPGKILIAGSRQIPHFIISNETGKHLILIENAFKIKFILLIHVIFIEIL